MTLPTKQNRIRHLVLDSIERSTRGMRLKRMFEFLRIMRPSKQSIILDVGGYPDLWVQCGYKGRIVFLNLEAPQSYRSIPSNCRYVQGNACCLNYPDKSFEIVFSNSVIEHVGNYSNQKTFAHEVSRVGKRYWVQTPNKNFPIENHFNFPLFQFIPLKTRLIIAKYWPFSWPKKYGEDAQTYARSIRLLTIDQLKALFTDGKVYKERFLGITKSIVVFK